MPPSLPIALRHRTASCELRELDESLRAPRPRSNAPMAAPGEPALAPSMRTAPAQPPVQYPM